MIHKFFCSKCIISVVCKEPCEKVKQNITFVHKYDTIFMLCYAALVLTTSALLYFLVKNNDMNDMNELILQIIQAIIFLPPWIFYLFVIKMNIHGLYYFHCYKPPK